MFGGPNAWTARALLLAEVLTTYEASLCRDCGQHSYLAFDPLNTGHFRLDDSTVCLGCEAIRNYRDSDPWPGTKLYVTTDLGGDDD